MAGSLARVPAAGLVGSPITWHELAVSPRTRRMYEREWAAFVEWCAAFGRDALPGDATAVADYLKHLAKFSDDDGDDAEVPPGAKAVATVERVRAALGVVYQWRASQLVRAGQPAPPNPARDLLVVHTVRRIRKRVLDARKPISEPKHALSYDELVRMVRSEPDTLPGRRNAALMAVGWWGTMRRSELVGIRMRDLIWDPKSKGYAIFLPKSKTDRYGRGSFRSIVQRDDAPVCPVRALRAYLEAAGLTIDKSRAPVFRRVFRCRDGWSLGTQALHPNYVRLLVREAAQRVGVIAPDEVAGHSLRSGSATELGQANVSDKRVMDKGGWSTHEQVVRYVRAAQIVAADPMRTIDLVYDKESSS
jgi:integrase